MRFCGPIRPSSVALTATPTAIATAISVIGTPARIHTRGIEAGQRAPRLQSRIVTRSSCPVTVPAPVAPGAPPYWLKYGRSLMALPARVNSVHTMPKNITTSTAANVPLPPANATTVMTTKLGGFAVSLCEVAYVVLAVFQQEELDRHV